MLISFERTREQQILLHDPINTIFMRNMVTILLCQSVHYKNMVNKHMRWNLSTSFSNWKPKFALGMRKVSRNFIINLMKAQRRSRRPASDQWSDKHREKDNKISILANCFDEIVNDKNKKAKLLNFEFSKVGDSSKLGKWLRQKPIFFWGSLLTLNVLKRFLL